MLPSTAFFASRSFVAAVALIGLAMVGLVGRRVSAQGVSVPAVREDRPRVVRPDGGTVGGATVTFIQSGGRGLTWVETSVTTDADGCFRLPQPPDNDTEPTTRRGGRSG